MDDTRLQMIKKFLGSKSNSEFNCYGGHFSTDYGIDYYIDKHEDTNSTTDKCRLCLLSNNPILLFSAADILGIFNYKSYTKLSNGEIIYCLEDNNLTVFNHRVMKVICSIGKQVIDKSLELLDSDEYRFIFEENREQIEYSKQNYIRSLFLKNKKTQYYSESISNIKYK